MSMMIVGISGKRGSGKTSTAKAVVEMLKGQGIRAIRCSFAYCLKLTCGALFSIPDELLYGDDAKKETMLPCGKTVRQVLQQFGEAGRAIDPFVWINGALKFARESKVKVVIFDDMRYENEAANVDLTIRLPRWNGVVDNHRSEIDLDDYLFDAVVPNHLLTLQETARRVYGLIRRRLQ